MNAHQPGASAWNNALGRTARRSGQVLLILLLASVAVFALSRLSLIVIPVLLALILASAINPVVNWLRGKGWPSTAATVTSFVVLVAAFGGLITGIVFAIRSEWGSLVEQAGAGIGALVDLAKDSPLKVDQDALKDMQDSAVGLLTSSAAGSGALAGISAAGSFLTGFALMAVVLFYFLKDGDRIWGFLLRWTSGERQAKARLAGTRAMDVLGSYIRGTATVAAVDAICIGAALFVLGVPLALPLSVIVFVGSFIPLVGATAAGVLAALIALVANGPVVALIVVTVVVVVNQLEGNLLQPVVMGKALNIHSLVILLALTAGTILAGIIGAILAVPLTAVAWSVIKVYTGEDAGDPEPAEPAGTGEEPAEPVAVRSPVF